MIKFNGSREAYGEFYGRRLKAFGHNFYSHINVQTLHKQLEIYQQYYPELITERLAAAEALNQDPDFLLYEDLAAFVDNYRHRINQRKHGCTIFAVHENGKTFIGRNYDWLPQARNFFERYDFSFPKSNRYFALSDESVYTHHTGKKTRKIYAEDAINENGLYIGLTYSHIDQWTYGLSPSHFILYVAEHCSTTRQALNAFAKIPCAIPKNFLIADAKGDIAVVEHAAKDYDIIKPDQSGILVQTNHCLSSKLQSLDQVLRDNPKHDTFVRYAEAQYLIAKQMPNFQFTDIWRILRQSQYIYNSETIWSLALELSEQRFNIYYDTAQGQKQSKFEF